MVLYFRWKFSYEVAPQGESLVITGLSIKTQKIRRKAWIIPFQRCQRYKDEQLRLYYVCMRISVLDDLRVD